MACGEKCFTFIWKLENASCCLEKNNEPIYSPEFVVDPSDETKWHVGLYLRGDDDENYIACYLFREEDINGAVPKKIKYELAFINKNGSDLTSRVVIEYDFFITKGHGFPEFVRREEVFTLKRSEFLPQDTLTTRCRIWKSDGKMQQDIQCFALTRIGIQKRSFLWNVKNFSTLEFDKMYTYALNPLAHDKKLMSINLFFTEDLDSVEIIHFEIIHQDLASKFSTLQLSLVDVSGNKVLCNRDEFWFNDTKKTQVLKFFFTRNKIMEMKSSYLPDDILSLRWEWAFSGGVISNSIEDIQYACASFGSQFSGTQNVNNGKMMPVLSALNGNLKSFYDENFLCDVKLKTCTRTFEAHKIILSASSSVFKAMFSNDMKENNSNIVNIEDLNDDTVSQMLFFMYTARVEDLTWEKVSHLYAAADKYAILSLKDVCSTYLKENFSRSNAIEVLLLSDFHADGDLKAAVQDYILKHIKNMVNSDEWEVLMETNSKLAAETVCLQYK